MIGNFIFIAKIYTKNKTKVENNNWVKSTSFNYCTGHKY